MIQPPRGWSASAIEKGTRATFDFRLDGQVLDVHLAEPLPDFLFYLIGPAETGFFEGHVYGHDVVLADQAPGMEVVPARHTRYIQDPFCYGFDVALVRISLQDGARASSQMFIAVAQYEQAYADGRDPIQDGHIAEDRNDAADKPRDPAGYVLYTV